MAKRLPPITGPYALAGPIVDGYTVGSWSSTPDATGPAEAVAIAIHTPHGDLVLRMKTPAAVDLMIQSLLRHKRDVWPETP